MMEYAERFPNELSGGQQQRVALARALILEPKVLLMNEPLSNLDYDLKRLLREEVLRLHEELGITILYVTHDLDEAFFLGTRIVVMERGGVRGETIDSYFNRRYYISLWTTLLPGKKNGALRDVQNMKAHLHNLNLSFLMA